MIMLLQFCAGHSSVATSSVVLATRLFVRSFPFVQRREANVDL